MNSKITFTSNNVKGILNLVKRIKLFEYLKCYVTAYGFIFSARNTFLCKQWNQVERRAQHRAIFLQRKKQTQAELLQAFTDLKQKNRQTKISDKSRKFLSVVATINDMVLVLINIYNPNSELEQLETFSDLVSILNKVKNIQNESS